MPHPDNLVSVTSVTETAAAPQDSYNTLGLVGSAPTAEAPPAGFNTARRYTTAEGVATDYEEASDVHVAAQKAFAGGLDSLVVVVLEETSYTEDFGAEADTATVENAPMSGVTNVSVVVDGVEMETQAVTSSPPVTLVDEAAPAEGEAVYNADTGEVVSGTTSEVTSGTFEVTYPTLSWTEGLGALYGVDADIVVGADRRYDRSDLGDLDELLSWADANDAAVPVPYVNGQQFTDARDGMELAWDMGTALPSKFGLPVASESIDEVGAAIGQQFAVNPPYYDIFNKTLNASVPGGSRYESLVGAPDLPGTFEGGDQGSGASNVLVDDGGAVLTNSLTLSGIESAYRYLDVARTEALVRDLTQTAASSAFRDNAVRFNNQGRTTIQTAIEEAIGPYVGEGEQPLRDLAVSVPPAEALAQNARANRIWKGIQVSATLTGNAHRAEIDLNITL